MSIANAPTTQAKPPMPLGDTLNWDGGQRLGLQVGQTATCTTLTNQLYAIFLYNENGADKDIRINVTGSNQTAPLSVTVPGTTAGQGLASIVLVDGGSTSSISVNVDLNAPAGVDAWIGSLSMPTNTSGLQNRSLPTDGSKQPFDKYVRYYAIPASHWYELSLNSSVNQFFSVQFTQGKITVFCVNPTQNSLTSSPYIHLFTGFNQANFSYQAAPVEHPQHIDYQLQGNGLQTVWMNADSAQDSNDATIALGTLQATQ